VTRDAPSTSCTTVARRSPSKGPEVGSPPNGRVMSPSDSTGPFGLPRYALCQSVAPALEHNNGPCTCWY
jgi:hypothetical protein